MNFEFPVAELVEAPNFAFDRLRHRWTLDFELKSTDNGQQSTVRGYAVAELVEAPRVVPSTGSGTVHKVV